MQDACAICEGDRSTTKNPIMFCDGKGIKISIGNFKPRKK